MQNKFEEFYKNIFLTNECNEYKDARKKDDAIVEKIKNKFKTNEYSVKETFIQGSWATHTAIKQKGVNFDIDRAIVISESDAPSDPLKPKNAILDVLEGMSFKNAKIKTPCVTAGYKNIDLHIDLPVYSKDDDGNYKLAIGKPHSQITEWGNSDPKGLINWVNNFDAYKYNYEREHRRQFRRLVCYIKKWRNEKFTNDIKSKLFSIGLTIMIKECFQPSIDKDGVPDDLAALKNTISHILSFGNYLISDGKDGYKIRVALPVSPYRDIYNDAGSSERGTQFYNKLSTLNNKLQDAIDEADNLKKQCEILNKQFGDDFPVIADSNVKKASIGFLSAGTVGTSQGA